MGTVGTASVQGPVAKVRPVLKLRGLGANGAWLFTFEWHECRQTRQCNGMSAVKRGSATAER